MSETPNEIVVDETLQNLQAQSAVGKKRRQKAPIILVGVVGLVLGVYWFFSGSDKNEFSDKVTPRSASSNLARDEAKANIYQLHLKIAETEKLLAEKKRKEESMLAAASGDPNGNTEVYSKLYLARLNAPTTVYEASASVDAHTENTQNNTVAVSHASPTQGLEGFQAPNKPLSRIEASRIAHPDFTITQGTLFSATLEPIVNTDLPGMVRAVISTPVYSSDGKNILLPKGSRLIGQYQSATLQDQNRIFLIWSRVITPDAISVQLNSPSTDSLGQGGLRADVVNTHFWARFGEAALLSILSAGASTLGVNNETQYNSMAAYRQSVADALGVSAQQSLQSTVSIKPTLIAYQGKPIHVFVAHDVSLYDTYHQNSLHNRPTTLPLSSEQIQKLKRLYAAEQNPLPGESHDI